MLDETKTVMGFKQGRKIWQRWVSKNCWASIKARKQTDADLQQVLQLNFDQEIQFASSSSHLLKEYIYIYICSFFPICFPPAMFTGLDDFRFMMHATEVVYHVDWSSTDHFPQSLHLLAVRWYKLINQPSKLLMDQILNFTYPRVLLFKFGRGVTSNSFCMQLII